MDSISMDSISISMDSISISMDSISMDSISNERRPFVKEKRVFLWRSVYTSNISPDFLFRQYINFLFFD